MLLDPEGNLTEGTSGNVFLVADGALQTPLAKNILPGVTRGLVLELAARLEIPTAETSLTPADARGASEMFLTSTSIGILHARSFVGKTIGDGSLGPITARLRAALFAELGLDLAEQARNYARRLAE